MKFTFFGFLKTLKKLEELINSGKLTEKEKYKNIFEMVEKYHSYTRVVNAILENSEKELTPDELRIIGKRFLSAFRIKEEFEMLSAIIDVHFKDCNEIRFKGIGYYSVAIQFGNQVLKLSQSDKYMQVYHPKTLMPYFRKQFTGTITEYNESLSRKQEKNISNILEIFDLADIDFENIPEDVPLEIYKEYEKDGYNWRDAKKDNIGRAKKDNTLPDWLRDYSGEDLSILGITCKYTKEELEKRLPKKGDYVNIDLQYVEPIEAGKKRRFFSHADPLVIKYVIEINLKISDYTV